MRQKAAALGVKEDDQIQEKNAIFAAHDFKKRH